MDSIFSLGRARQERSKIVNISSQGKKREIEEKEKMNLYREGMYSRAIVGLPTATQKAYTYSGTSFKQIFCYLLMHIQKSFKLFLD